MYSDACHSKYGRKSRLYRNMNEQLFPHAQKTETTQFGSLFKASVAQNVKLLATVEK